MNIVSEGQGDVPWHRSTSFAITDALTARIDYSTGNLMLTATDFDIAGVGQQLRLARTYNSLDAPYGQVAQRGRPAPAARTAHRDRRPGRLLRPGLRCPRGPPPCPSWVRHQRRHRRQQDPYPDRQCHRSETQLHLRRRGPLLLRQGGEGRQHHRLLAVLLRPGRQPHQPGHRPGLPARYHLHLQRRPGSHRQVRQHRHLVLRPGRQRDRRGLHQ
ncbi:DUF6531 domain-containing protein [Streptomyces griseoluteus]|uniref:DUF6531 domain-containing protein n=1 Tax=Streptomyces griseoluteus TaxID=29306 RepID=UPI0036C63B71